MFPPRRQDRTIAGARASVLTAIERLAILSQTLFDADAAARLSRTALDGRAASIALERRPVVGSSQLRDRSQGAPDPTRSAVHVVAQAPPPHLRS
jgi:hypothetical protein